jgi:hypothetical protein
MAFGARDLFVPPGKDEPRTGVIERTLEIPPGGVVTGSTVRAELASVGILMAALAIRAQAKIRPLRIRGAGLEGLPIADPLRSVAAPAFQRRVFAFQLPARLAMVERAHSLLTPPRQRCVAPLVLDMAVLAHGVCS